MPTRIDPDSFYDDNALFALGFSSEALARARRAGELRSVRAGRNGRALYRGQWVLDWLDTANTGEPAAVTA